MEGSGSEAHIPGTSSKGRAAAKSLIVSIKVCGTKRTFSGEAHASSTAFLQKYFWNDKKSEMCFQEKKSRTESWDIFQNLFIFKKKANHLPTSNFIPKPVIC